MLLHISVIVNMFASSAENTSTIFPSTHFSIWQIPIHPLTHHSPLLSRSIMGHFEAPNRVRFSDTCFYMNILTYYRLLKICYLSPPLELESQCQRGTKSIFQSLWQSNRICNLSTKGLLLSKSISYSLKQPVTFFFFIKEFNTLLNSTSTELLP